MFHYNPNQFPKHITKKMIFDSQREFNPITQKFYDNNKEQNFIKNSRNAKINMISKGYDNQLEEETTYDIINLQDRLKVFKNHPGYPNLKNEYPKLELSGNGYLESVFRLQNAVC